MKEILTVEIEIRCRECSYLMIRCGGNASMVLTPPTKITCRMCGKVHVFKPSDTEVTGEGCSKLRFADYKVNKKTKEEINE